MSIAAEKLPLLHRDVRKKKLTRRCHAAIVYKKSYRAAAVTRWVINLPLPRWFSKKCSKFH
jgi:hypothetical protein